jgi:hypothetical protein
MRVSDVTQSWRESYDVPGLEGKAIVFYGPPSPRGGGDPGFSVTASALVNGEPYQAIVPAKGGSDDVDGLIQEAKTKLQEELALVLGSPAGALTAAFVATSEVRANITRTEAAPAALTWETAEIGYIQAMFEEVVRYVEASDLLGLQGDDRLTAEAIRDLLSGLTKVAETPDKSVVRGALRWLGHKADIFVEAAAKSAGKAVGPLAIGAALMYVPPLRHLLNDLNALAGQSGG